MLFTEKPLTLHKNLLLNEFVICIFDMNICTIYSIIPLLSMPGGWEWIIILVVVLLLFGGKKIPELMKGVGKGVRSFKEGLNEAANEAAPQKGKASEKESSEKD